MATEKQIQEKYIMNPDGSVKEVIKTEIEVEVPSIEETIKEKEAELLKMYQELTKLKEI